MKLLLRLCVLTFCMSLSVAVLADGIDKRSETEGKFLDPSCNCERSKKPDGPIDKDLLARIRKDVGDPKKMNPKEDAKKLLAKVKSYRCPKVKPKDEFGLDDDMEMDASEILDGLIVKAEINPDSLNYDMRERAEEVLEKKITKCRQEAMAKQGGAAGGMGMGMNGQNKNQNQNAQYLQSMYQMMQMYQMQQSMSSMYGMSGMNGMSGMSGSAMMGMSLGIGTNGMNMNGMYSYPYSQTGTLMGYSSLPGYSGINTTMLGMNSSAGLLGTSGSLPYYRSYQNTGNYSPYTYYRGY